MQDDVLSIETPLMLKWNVLSESISPSSLRQNNLLTFSLLETFAEQQSAAYEAHSSSPELQRIENKLNLLIDMVSQLSGQSQQQHTPVSVRFSCKTVEWLSDSGPAETASLLLELYLDGEMQHALKIIARVVSVTERDGRYLVQARFTSLDETEKNHLEKWIFAHHRRIVAQTRARDPSS